MIYEFEGICNIRDLSDVPLENGRKIKPHTLLRSGHLSHATPADAERLQAMGVKTILDFRDPIEQEKRRDMEIPGASYESLPAFCELKPPAGVSMEAWNAEFHDNPGKFMDFAYTYMVDGENALRAWKRLFAVLLEAKGAPVLWHCKQGKDRTGIAALLISTALGASLEAAEADYLLTNAVMQPWYERKLREDPESGRFMKRYLFVSEERLRLFCEKAGDLHTYLERVLGIDEEKRRLLQKYYTTE